ncbi:BTAD domain-containing putative transcriptional regulator [Paenarthrobacter sp. CM16]|uniref:AfsR/SARP family transcriptional regulator n=1 Tax=Paenarthrobacter sp. CM16 TaxID=2738447 RepID=UPI001C12FFAE|nr:BTAD domain-containing putative transcriptional regulator [Paenarthrobacter sp. CM16]
MPQIRVLGPIMAMVDGAQLELSKRRHREIIAILVALRGRAISTASLAEELWDGMPPAAAVGAIRTFVGELRRILEPHRKPRTPPSVLVTVGDGYALRLHADAVDAWRFETAVALAGKAAPIDAESRLSTALAEWSGNAYQEFADRPWAIPEATRLSGLRQTAVERCAEARLANGRPTDAAAILETHVAANPWREEGWRLLALALYRSHRQADALAALRRARRQLSKELGLDPSPVLIDLETQILRRDRQLNRPEGDSLTPIANAYSSSGIRARLEASNAVLGSLAVAGDLQTSRHQRIAAIEAAADLNDPQLAARIIGGYDVPGIWTRADDPAAAAAVIAAAENALASTIHLSDRIRARLLGTIAMESRGTGSRQSEAAESVALARKLGDSHVLCFALSSSFMQGFARAGLAEHRLDLGRQLITTAFDADSPTFEINGRLMRMQALCAMSDIESAALEATAVDQLAARHERPLATVFTQWFRWTFLGAGTAPPAPEGMPGFSEGIVALASFTRQLRDGDELTDGNFGPYEPWVRPLLLLRSGEAANAAAALRQVPDPPRDLLLEATWCILAKTACELREPSMISRALTALAPASGERAAGSGVVDAGDVGHYLGMLRAAGAGLG